MTDDVPPEMGKGVLPCRSARRTIEVKAYCGADAESSVKRRNAPVVTYELRSTYGESLRAAGLKVSGIGAKGTWNSPGDRRERRLRAAIDAGNIEIK